MNITKVIATQASGYCDTSTGECVTPHAEARTSRAQRAKPQAETANVQRARTSQARERTILNLGPSDTKPAALRSLPVSDRETSPEAPHGETRI